MSVVKAWLVSTSTIAVCAALSGTSSCRATYRSVGGRDYQHVAELKRVPSKQLYAQVGHASRRARGLALAGAQDAQSEGRQLIATGAADPSWTAAEKDLFAALSERERADELYTQPVVSGLLPAIASSVGGREALVVTTDGAISSAEYADGFFEKFLEQLQSSSGINLATITSGGKFTEVLTTDVLRFGLGGSKQSTLEAIQFQLTAGSVVVDDAGEADGGFAGSLGLSVPVGEAGSVGVGYGTYRDGDEWADGLYLSFNLFGSAPVTNN